MKEGTERRLLRRQAYVLKLVTSPRAPHTLLRRLGERMRPETRKLSLNPRSVLFPLGDPTHSPQSFQPPRMVPATSKYQNVDSVPNVSFSDTSLDV